MTEIYPYALVPEDPTQQIVVCWLDDRTDADGSSQTLDYNDGSVSADGDLLPDTGAYIYHAEIDGLEPDTAYSGQIDGEKSVEWETLPESLAGDELKLVVHSDLHIDRGDGMDDPEQMEPLEAEDPDIVLLLGDQVSWADEVGEEDGYYMTYLTEYLPILNQDRLRPIFFTPGNHDVGNHSWDGTGSVDPDTGYIDYVWPYPKSLDPTGENYGEVTIGNYLQLLGLDTHSAHPEDVADWMDEAIDETVNFSLPIHHSPLFPGGDRNDADKDLQELLRDEWAGRLYQADNIHCHFSGHIHLRSRSLPWEVSDSDDDDSEEIPEGYVVEKDDGRRVVEFGGGWSDGRRPDRYWFLEESRAQNQYYSVTVKEDLLTVEELRPNGSRYHVRSFGPRRASLSGATLSNATF